MVALIGAQHLLFPDGEKHDEKGDEHNDAETDGQMFATVGVVFRGYCRGEALCFYEGWHRAGPDVAGSEGDEKKNEEGRELGFHGDGCQGVGLTGMSVLLSIYIVPLFSRYVNIPVIFLNPTNNPTKTF